MLGSYCFILSSPATCIALVGIHFMPAVFHAQLVSLRFRKPGFISNRSIWSNITPRRAFSGCDGYFKKLSKPTYNLPRANLKCTHQKDECGGGMVTLGSLLPVYEVIYGAIRIRSKTKIPIHIDMIAWSSVNWPLRSVSASTRVLRHFHIMH